MEEVKIFRRVLSDVTPYTVDEGYLITTWHSLQRGTVPTTATTRPADDKLPHNWIIYLIRSERFVRSFRITFSPPFSVLT